MADNFFSSADTLHKNGIKSSRTGATKKTNPNGAGEKAKSNLNRTHKCRKLQMQNRKPKCDHVWKVGTSQT